MLLISFLKISQLCYKTSQYIRVNVVVSSCNVKKYKTKMPTSNSCHKDNRVKVSGLVVKKYRLEKINKITSRILVHIKEFLDSDYCLENEVYPLSVCASCRNKLSKKAKGENVNLPSLPNYSNIVLPKDTRIKNECNCFICLTGRHKGHVKRKVEEITNENGKFGSSSQQNLLILPEQPRKKNLWR